jgi:hypothetical protein
MAAKREVWVVEQRFDEGWELHALCFTKRGAEEWMNNKELERRVVRYTPAPTPRRKK